MKDVALGMPVRLILDGNDEAARDGSIKAIDPSADPVTRSIRLRAVLAKKDDTLLPGMFTKVSVLLPTTNATS